MPLPETLILFRHGVFEGNERAHLTGRAAEEAMTEGLGLHDFDDKELLPDGEAQANRMGPNSEKYFALIELWLTTIISATKRSKDLN